MLKKILILMSLVLFVAMGFLACTPDPEPIDPDNPPVQAFTVQADTYSFGYYDTKNGKVSLLPKLADIQDIMALDSIVLGGTVANPTVYTVGTASNNRAFYAENDVYYPQKDGKFDGSNIESFAVTNQGRGVAFAGGKSYLLLTSGTKGQFVVFEPSALVPGAATSLSNTAGNSPIEFDSDLGIGNMMMKASGDDVFVVGVDGTKMYLWNIAKATNPATAIKEFDLGSLEGGDAFGGFIITDLAIADDAKYVSVAGGSSAKHKTGIVSFVGAENTATYNEAKALPDEGGGDKFPYITSLISTAKGKVSYILWTATKGDTNYTGPKTGDTFEVYLDADISTAAKWAEAKTDSYADFKPPLVGAEDVFIIALGYDGSQTYAVGSYKDGETTKYAFWTGTGTAQQANANKLFTFEDYADYPKATFITKMATLR